MAGAFGFEKKNYDVSLACAERVLMPRVRESGEETLIVTDRFCCRQQIEQLDHRKALHLAQVLRLAQQNGRMGARGNENQGP